LPGAAIIIAGTTTGTVSDMQGEFRLEVESMDVTLVISFVGYKTMKFPLKGKTEIEIEMIRDVVEIENTGEMSDEKKKEIELKQKQQQIKEEELKKKQEQEMKEKQSQDQQQDEELFYIVEDMPSFEGGGTEAFVKYIQEKVEEKNVAEETGLSGTVEMKFTVNAKGKVTSVSVSESSGEDELDKIATVLIYGSPEWKPGKQRGKPVAVEFKIPVVFK
jgi:TonB family protein